MMKTRILYFINGVLLVGIFFLSAFISTDWTIFSLTRVETVIVFHLLSFINIGITLKYVDKKNKIKIWSLLMFLWYFILFYFPMLYGILALTVPR